MKTHTLAFYDAFSSTAFGGSQAVVILDAATIDREQRLRIAAELGMPATAFVDKFGADWIQVQFMSTVMELPMCGHGTLCLLTHLLESGLIEPGHDVELRLSRAKATVSTSRTDSGRFLVMLDIVPPGFEAAPPHRGNLLTCLGFEAENDRVDHDQQHDQVLNFRAFNPVLNYSLHSCLRTFVRCFHRRSPEKCLAT